MKSQVNSINQNGCSVCKAGEENYTTFRPAHSDMQEIREEEEYLFTQDGQLIDMGLYKEQTAQLIYS
jgi:hypothetical protein